MSIRTQFASALIFSAFLATSAIVNVAQAGAREEGRLLTATEVLEEVQAMPDQQIPDALLSRAYGIAVIPDVTKVAFIFGGRHGNGVLVVRDKLNTPWSNPTFVALTGGSWGFQAGAQSSDIILVFTTKAGIALDGSHVAIDRSANAALYGKTGVTATEIFSGQAPAAPATAQRFLERLAKATHTAVRGSPAPQADVPAAAAQAATGAAPSAEPPRTYPLEQQK